jgi:hypothetical protein
MTWLFVAYFKDGSVMVQDQADKSRVTGKHSAFYDVYNRIDDVLMFELQNTDGEQVIGIDLKTGVFMVNGTALIIHDQNFEPETKKLELIYFTETHVDHEVSGTVQEDGSIKPNETAVARHYANRYFVGWRTTWKGKEYKVTMAVG